MTFIPSRWHWVVGGDESRYWSGATGAYVQTLPAEAGVTRISDEAELTAVLETHGLVGPIPIRRRVDKWVIAERIEAAGKSDDAYDLLTMQGNRAAFIKWNMPVESVYHDDAETVAMLTALGLDPEAILAP